MPGNVPLTLIHALPHQSVPYSTQADFKPIVTDCDGQQSFNSELTGQTKLPISTLTKHNWKYNKFSCLKTLVLQFGNPYQSSRFKYTSCGGYCTTSVYNQQRLIYKINHPKMPSEQVLLWGAGKGSKIIANKFSNVSLIIGDQTYHWDLLVAPIEDSFLSGLDFLIKAHSGIINLMEDCHKAGFSQIPKIKTKENCSSKHTTKLQINTDF